MQEAFCLSGGRVSEDAQGFTAPSCSLLLPLPYGQFWVYHIDPFNILGGDLIYMVCM